MPKRFTVVIDFPRTFVPPATLVRSQSACSQLEAWYRHSATQGCQLVLRLVGEAQAYEFSC
jgi:hypothetical protein